MKTKQRSLKLGAARIRMFPFSCDWAYHSVVYDLVKTRFSESQEEAEEKNQSKYLFPIKCDWSNVYSGYDFGDLGFTGLNV